MVILIDLWGKNEVNHRFIIADDHPLFLDALSLAVKSQYSDADIMTAASLDEVSAQLERDDDVDLILLDLKMPGVHGFSGLMYLRAQFPSVPVLVVSATEDDSVIQRCLDFGASGFLPKSLGAEAIGHGVACVLAGNISRPEGFVPGANGDYEHQDLARKLTSLTPQQVRVLMMLKEGLLNKQIAYKLSVSEATVKAHVSAILQKLGVDSRTQAVIAASKIEVADWQPDND